MNLRVFLTCLGILWALFAGFVACVMLSISPMLTMAFDAPGSTDNLSIYSFIAVYFLFIFGLVASIPIYFKTIRSINIKQIPKVIERYEQAEPGKDS